MRIVERSVYDPHKYESVPDSQPRQRAVIPHVVQRRIPYDDWLQRALLHLANVRHQKEEQRAGATAKLASDREMRHPSNIRFDDWLRRKSDLIAQRLLTDRADADIQERRKDERRTLLENAVREWHRRVENALRCRRQQGRALQEMSETSTAASELATCQLRHQSYQRWRQRWKLEMQRRKSRQCEEHLKRPVVDVAYRQMKVQQWRAEKAALEKNIRHEVIRLVSEDERQTEARRSLARERFRAWLESHRPSAADPNPPAIQVNGHHQTWKKRPIVVSYSTNTPQLFRMPEGVSIDPKE
ncbi:Uncharacterized protein PBTT_01496 [Plasmodiophora brassicae]